MNISKQAFSLNFVIKNADKRFYLQRARKSSIPSDIRFKTKPKKICNVADSNTLPQIRNINMISTIQFNRQTNHRQGASVKNEVDIHRNDRNNTQQKDGLCQFDLRNKEISKFSTISFKHTFPSIDNVKDQQNCLTIELTQQQKKSQRINKTVFVQKKDIQIFKIVKRTRNKLDNQFQDLISKQISKTAKQIQLKLDQQLIHENSKEIIKQKCRRMKKKKICPQKKVNEQQNHQEQRFTLSGHEIKVLTPTGIKQMRKTMMGLCAIRSKSFRYSPENRKCKINERINSLCKQINSVQGWTNQNENQLDVDHDFGKLAQQNYLNWHNY